MDTGKIKDNYKYFEGYEGFGEIVLYSDNEDMEILHIWDGFFSIIFEAPPLDASDWKGFTRDYHQIERTLADNGECVSMDDIQEYIDDLLFYKDREFDEETREVYDLIYSWLVQALKTKSKVIVIDD